MKIHHYITCLITLLSCSVMTSQITLPKIVGNGMILQRDENVKIWGWASAGEVVKIKFNKKQYTAATNTEGIWSVTLSPTKTGGPYTMEISGKNTIVLNDILMGDVWLCAGQSNMVHQMRLHNVIYAEEIAKANNPQIRQFFVQNTTNLTAPQNDLKEGSWKTATRENIGEFSAVAYFFAKKLYETNEVPIGIINASWGGTPIESWISQSGFKNFPEVLNLIAKNKDTAYIAGQKVVVNKLPEPEDRGMSEQWYAPTYKPKGWHTIAIPGYWEDQGVRDLDGVMWYRREIEIPKTMDITQSKLFMGRIVDADEVYINGSKIGNTTYMYPQRRYEIKQGILHPGKNLFVIRVTNNSGKGGFVPDKPYQLITDKDTLDLTGYWQYKVGRVNTPAERMPGSNGINLQNQPTALYNAMVAPLVNYSIKGFVWYQGESNAGKPEEYTKLQTALIQDWRTKWNNDLPFLFAQLPGYMDYRYLPSESQWAQFREAQAKTLSIPKTGMAVAIDLGEWNDIHPDRKKEVGERLALAAEKVAYGKNAAGSPYYKSNTIEGNKITVYFSNTGKGLTTSDGDAPGEFAIAGADKKFVWAKTKIEGDKIVIWNENVSNPLYVRYAWADNPVNPNLVNAEGLPAAPFRTDK